MFVSNLMETELKINLLEPHDVQSEVWDCSGHATEVDRQPQCIGRLNSRNAAWPWVDFYVLLDIFFSQLCGISFVSAFCSLLHLWWLCRWSDKKLIQLGAPVSQPCTPSTAWTLTNTFFILKPCPRKFWVCCWALWCCPRALSALCQEWLGGGNGPSALRAWTP